MGSLLPGWDTAQHVTPRDHSEDEGTDPVGYFARLQQQRSLRHTKGASPDGTTAPAGASAFAAPTTQSISRRASIGHEPGDAYASVLLQRVSSTGKPKTPPGAELRRTSTSTAYGSRSKPNSYPLTDWTKELDALRDKRPKEHHMHHGQPKAQARQETGPWWQHTDGGALNMGHAEAQQEDRAAQHGTYVPQFALRSLSIRDGTPQKAL